MLVVLVGGGELKIFAWPVSAVFAFHILFASISYFFVFSFHMYLVYILFLDCISSYLNGCGV